MNNPGTGGNNFPANVKSFGKTVRIYCILFWEVLSFLNSSEHYVQQFTKPTFESCRNFLAHAFHLVAFLRISIVRGLDFLDSFA